MTIQEIENQFDELTFGNPSHLESWVIRRNGGIVKLPNGKCIWKKKNHAGAALTNYISNIYDWEKMRELRKNLGVERRDSLGQYLIEKGIVTIEPL